MPFNRECQQPHSSHHLFRRQSLARHRPMDGEHRGTPALDSVITDVLSEHDDAGLPSGHSLSRCTRLVNEAIALRRLADEAGALGFVGLDAK
ncbi:MAG: hypothetical protein ACRYGP_30045 [Janthinobacterium lividum]